MPVDKVPGTGVLSRRMIGFHTSMRNIRLVRVIGLAQTGAFAVLLILSALCPLPSVAMGQDPSWDDRDVRMVECPFHPGQRATFSTAFQFSLEHLYSLPAEGDPLTSPLMNIGSDVRVPFQPDRPASCAIDLRVARPHPVPLYLLHASLIR
ncbi:MAG: hypothetical protein HY207_01370 [Nitrospirae bacterium]|nr:hypothetical protein [Nitrospirota bacterium]